MLIPPRIPGATPAQDIERLVRAIHSLRDAEAFYEYRSEITGQLLRIARHLDHNGITHSNATMTATRRPHAPPRSQPMLTMRPAVEAPVASPKRPVRARSASGRRRHRYPMPPRDATAALF